MSEGAEIPKVPLAEAHFATTIEHSMIVKSNTTRHAIRADSVASIVDYKAMFASITLTGVSCEVRQSAIVGNDEGDLYTTGHIFLAIIPTGKNTDAQSGTSAEVVHAVPRKSTFPLSSGQQSVALFNFDLNGYEVDLAQDPRRQQGPVLWVGNSGVKGRGPKPVEICSMTWRLQVRCTGGSTLWL